MANETKHTPGPWTLGACGPTWQDVRVGHGRIVQVHQANSRYSCVDDARLIAAAPELLEALERLTRIAAVELGTTRPEVIEQARAAIAKAKEAARG